MTPQSYGRQPSHEGEELYRLLTETSTDMISRHTSEGVYTYVSPACRSLLGYEPEELVGHSAYEFFHPDDLEHSSTTHSLMPHHHDPNTVSYRIRRKDGSYIWFETSSRRVRGPGTDEYIETIAVSRDITDRKRVDVELRESQEALGKSEQFHRFAVEAGRIGTWDLDLRTEECLVSPEMAELMGFSRDQATVPGPQWRESIIPEDRTLMASALAASIENDTPFDLEFRIALKDGRERWLYSRAGVTRDASGKALRVHGASIDVTERKRAEENLRESEGRLRRAIEIETVGVIFFTTDGRITDANDAFLLMSGYSREELAEGLLQWDEMTPPEWMPQSVKAIEEFRLTGRTIPYEKEYVRKDGSRWRALFAATRLDEEEGVEFIIDITERKRAEEALQEASERITNVLERITDAFFAVDSRWRFTYLNRQAERILQRRREELLGQSLWQEFPDAVGSRFYEKYHEAVESGTSVHFEEFYEALNHWVEVHAYPSGEGLTVYFRDVTERKRAREALHESEQRLRAVFDSTLDAILIANDDREYTEVNPAACRLLGVARKDLLGSRLEDFVPEAEKETAREGWREFLEKGRMEGEFRLRRTDGAIRIAEFRAKADFLPGRHLSVLRDITERKRADEAIAEVLRARTEFMANVSHELRTPLTVIRGNAEVGLELGRECVHEEILEEIVRESGSMSRMVEDLLFLARSDSDSIPLDKQMVSVAWLLAKLAQRAGALARKRGTSLQTTLSGEGRLRCDAQSIEQAVLVLVDNAAKYGMPGGPITLSSSNHQRELVIEVTDRGPGIPPEELPQIFERFYRGEKSSREPGSGLGLAIAKSIAEAHDGSVETESRPGEGTRMSLRLPLVNSL
ncbi:MAG: PAS domain S-box protein [Rubrobacteraceae bacterium]|nr:PAS domain S-box protein [Rubrobacteraceae bacterium]